MKKTNFVLDLVNSIFGDPVIRDVDDDELPLPEHRNNTDHVRIYDEPEMKRIRTEKAMPAIVKARDGFSGAALNASFVAKPTNPFAAPSRNSNPVFAGGMVISSGGGGSSSSTKKVATSSSSFASSTKSSVVVTSTSSSTTLLSSSSSLLKAADSNKSIASSETVGSKRTRSPAVEAAVSESDEEVHDVPPPSDDNIVTSDAAETLPQAYGSSTATTAPHPPHRSKSKSKETAVVKRSSTEEPSDDWTVAELKSYASEQGISLSGATRKTDILDKLLESTNAD